MRMSSTTDSNKVKLVHGRAALWISTSGLRPSARFSRHLTILSGVDDDDGGG